MANRFPQIDIVIPCFNDGKSLQQCLNSILSQKTSRLFRVLVVNNNSTDNSEEIVKTFPQVTLLQEPKQGRSFARNKGIHESEADYICFIDADVILEQDWLEYMVSKMEQSALYGGGESHVSVRVSDESDLFMQLRAGNKVGRELMLQMRSYDYPMLNSAACIYRRKALVEINGFDENLNSYEDIDLSRRVALNGWILYTEKNAKAYSFNNRANVFGFGRRYFQLGQNRFLFNLKWSARSATEQFSQELLYFFTELKSILTIEKSAKYFKIRILKIFLLIVKNLGKTAAFINRNEVGQESYSNYRPFVDQLGNPCIICHINQTLVLYYFKEKIYKYITCNENLDLIIMGGFLHGQQSKIQSLL